MDSVKIGVQPPSVPMTPPTSVASAVAPKPVKSGSDALEVGDHVYLRFGGMGGLRASGVPNGAEKVPWEITAVEGQGHVFAVKCTRVFPIDPYWRQVLEYDWVTRDDIRGAPVDVRRAELGALL